MPLRQYWINGIACRSPAINAIGWNVEKLYAPACNHDKCGTLENRILRWRVHSPSARFDSNPVCWCVCMTFVCIALRCCLASDKHEILVRCHSQFLVCKSHEPILLCVDYNSHIFPESFASLQLWFAALLGSLECMANTEFNLLTVSRSFHFFRFAWENWTQKYDWLRWCARL